MDTKEIKDDPFSTKSLASNGNMSKIGSNMHTTSKGEDNNHEIEQESDMMDIDVANDKKQETSVETQGIERKEQESGLDEDEEEDKEKEEEPMMSLPLSKIKRIFRQDPDYTAANPSAVYAAGLATELFVQYFVEQASVLAKIDKRKKIQYKDFSTAVSNNDSLSFLRDTVPKTLILGDAIKNGLIDIEGQKGNSGASEDLEVAEITNAKPVLPKGQRTLGFATAEPPTRPFKKAGISDLI